MIIVNYDCRLNGRAYRVSKHKGLYRLQESNKFGDRFKTLEILTKEGYNRLSEKYGLDNQYNSKSVVIYNMINDCYNNC